ncbi:MAG: hypothetical protein JKY65_13065 [Planctomycetes bacterium]|nr:hypothetical protein [Planctomycetota bacterium]
MTRLALSLLTRLGLVLCVFMAAGCLSIEPPPDFVEREEYDWSSYAYRALNADAVVLGVREIHEDKEASLGFWTKAVKNRLQASHAYAILGEETLKVASGETATLIRMGREDAGVQYDYWVALVDAGSTLYVIEAGGRREHFSKVEGALRTSIKSFSH